MNEKVGMVAIREVTREEFVEMAQIRARELFGLENYKVVDGLKGDEQSHFVYDMGTHRCYLIDLKTSYELVTAFFCGGSKPEILESLNQIASSVK
ncbi:hypothetical protein [Bacillus pinisoli]|uniref:hypothetical protein n=1 Tax=Bacillus pinisoli TaxID=2901866 RepID=UPI001FF42740|nr:hypothetical protein [Bacillus pinisoli]